MLDINQIKKKYGTEVALIILCCRVFLGTSTTIELSDYLTTAGVNWAEFMRLSRMHRVRPVVFKVILNADIPEDVSAVMRQKQLELIGQNLKVAAETERVILLLQKAGIEAIPYKGVAYSKQFFGDLVSREISDIDLVIRQDDLAQAIKTLNEDEYSGELEDIYQFLGDRYFSYFKDYNLNKLKNDQREFHLELHWAVTEKEIGVSEKARSFLYDTGEKEVVVKNPILIVKPLSHFASMLIHNTFKDNLVHMKNVIDISQAIMLPQVQDETCLLIDNFTDLSIRKSLPVNNRLSEQLFGVWLPQIKRYGDSEKTADYFLDQLCSSRGFSTSDRENMAKHIKNTALLQNSPYRKMLYYWLCIRFRFIPGRYDFRFIQLPKPLFFLYYFIKPFRTLTRPQGGA